MDQPEIGYFSKTIMIVEDLDDTVCFICSAEFLDAEDLKTHVIQVHLTEGRQLRYCELCSKVFPDLEKYMSHILYIHLSNLKCCKHCFRLFPDMASKMQHEKKHKYRCKKEIFCSQCNESFNDKMYLERHEYSVHRKSGDGLMINHGFPLLSSLLSMNVRRFLMGYNENIIYICACCQFTCNTMLAYIDHLQRKSCKASACDLCANVYHNRKNLIRHFSSNHGKHNIVECPKCHAMFTRSALYVHEKTCSLLKCLDCNLKFPSVTEITNHRIEKHKECALVNTCRFCLKQVVGDGMMKKHIARTHKSTLHLYKYKCVYCDIIYKHPKQLFGHFFSSHKELKPYTCTICNEKFRVRRKFTYHVHTVHKSIGCLEYNENYHVSFVEKKSINAFVPKTLYADFNSLLMETNDGNKTEKDAVTVPEAKAHKLPIDKDACKEGERVQEPENNTDKAPIEVIALDDSSTVETEAQSTPTATVEGKIKNNKIRKFRRKRTRIQAKDESSDDSETPLAYFRKVRKVSYSPWNRTDTKKIHRLSNKLICQKCNKNCYTLHNYRHHLSFHEKNVFKKCIKCKARFKSGKELNKHIEEKHSNSVLTETLKMVMERRKLEPDVRLEPIQTSNKRFKVAMKRVVPDPTDTLATLTRITPNNNGTVKNFIENFVPDVTANTAQIRDCVTMGITTVVRPQKILVRRCHLEELTFTGLKKPTKVAGSTEKHHVTIKQVDVMTVRRANLNYGSKRQNIHDIDHSYCEEGNNYETEAQNCDDQGYLDDDFARLHYIPDVAQEVMLGAEDVKVHQTIVVQNVPKEYKSIRIGTLQPEAPYYKIVKLDDIIINQPEKELVPEKKFVNLPDGTQLVSVNPLAHLIDTEGIKQKMPKKYYSCKPKDIGAAITKFLNDKPKRRARKEKLQDG